MENLGLILFILFCVIGSLSSKKKKGKSAKTNTQQSAPKQSAPAQRAPQAKPVFTPKAPTVTEPEARPQAQQARYYDSTCMEMDSKHDHDRRIEQLKDFLKDGIITREEYRILMYKYENNQ